MLTDLAWKLVTAFFARFCLFSGFYGVYITEIMENPLTVELTLPDPIDYGWKIKYECLKPVHFSIRFDT